MAYENIFGWCDYENIYRDMVDNNDNCILVEIGSLLGRSACYMAEYIKEKKKNIKVVCIDIFPTKDELNLMAADGVGQGAEYELLSNLPKSHIDTFTENMRIAKVDDIVIPIKSSSHKAAVLFQDNSIPGIMLDGGHHRHIIEKDLELYWPKVKSGGVLIGHDYFNFLQEVVDNFFGRIGLKPERSVSSFIMKKP